LGEQDENGIVRLNIDLLWQNFGKITTKFSFRATGRNGMQFSGMMEDMM
jgi:hypothetical protein